MRGTGETFQEKTRSKQLRVAVIGLGYVGLPLAVEFARAGVRVHGIDVNAARVQAIERGVSQIPDVSSTTLAPLVQAGRLSASTAYADCATADAAVICVPTPFTRMKAPDLSYIEAACTALAPHVALGSLIVLQSTTYPGTTEELVRPILEVDGRQAGRDFLLAFSPERIDP
ncbi:MAG TPA: NAD(P)-binding domain-containing protein, partial [Candidatus Methylomirabilis sp.]|nr:NAD(P)-binding domain-containing protein [Candidatus Methylomirabilis sp.]